MKKQLLAAIAAFGLIGASGSAQATMVAGWDFSQYFGDALLSTDGATFTDTLGANYSSLVPPAATNSGLGGLGPLAAQYGTMYLNGQFGSSNVGAGSGNETFWPTAALGGSLQSNLNAPTTDGFLNQFDQFTTLIFEGQTFAESLAMTNPGAVDVVFGVFPTLPGLDWVVTFGARSTSGNTSITIQFSSDGTDYQTVGSVALTPVDTPYSVALSGALSQAGFVRFRFGQPVGPDQSVIDNVAISATLIPEPGTALLLLTGLAGLTMHGRRRS